MTDRIRPAEVVTLGESMVLLQPLNEGPLAYAPLFARSVAGAESNVAIGLSRLGLRVRWISRLGADPFGDLIVSTLAGEGVDISFATRDETSPTAVYFKEFKGYGDPNVYYYRRHSAASGLKPEHIEDRWLADARHLHVTGITPALSRGAAETVREVMRRAREKGMTVSFDPNLRRKLWSEEEARETLLSLIPLCDVFMPGIEEAEFLAGDRSVEECGSYFLGMGPRTVVLKLGADGAIGFDASSTVRAEPCRVSRVVDTVGAGDAFAAGFLSSWLPEGSSALSSSLAKGNRMGALATQFRGDWEGLPKLKELERLLAGQRETTR
ncbi:sugar kinase [Cohnella thailandensis]|uniref:Sugar kinase n=1 Tax=Cohnella thailandensis TaxID=557557 RepID=A0A841STK2_9BACL|nr:sugar kinase [Cohnella thailandensis]MBB6635653.1 sugar kinase [Cohnella thailandensis]MBP1976030.1 2-dehydro-3-deoxygluconokinase [Cohnella thailandensis]